MQLHPFHRARRFGLVAALLALSFAAFGMTPAMAQSSGATPFKSDVSGSLVATSPADFNLTGSGQSTFLGHVRYAGSVHVTSTDGNGVLTDVMTETLTAANGDTLILHCEQRATPKKPGVYRGTDTWTVVGGTGRFAHATGSGSGSTEANLNVGTFSKTATGIIDLG
jgi:hypothetical protein